MTASTPDRAERVGSGRLGGFSGFLLRLLSLAALILLWEMASRVAGSRLMPSVETVAATFWDELAHGELLRQLGITLARVVAAFTVAMALGAALGLAMGRWRLLDLALDGWVVLLLNLPALVIAILAYVWFGLTEAAAIGAVAVNKLPLVAMTMREGARSLDRGYGEMATVFRLGAWRRFRHVVAPQLVPFLLVSARSGLSLVWKIVLVVELLGRSNGIGFELQLYFQLFDVPRILAYALAFTGVVQLIEWGILQPLERRAGAWRR
ncbi:MAG TPA: ABC transporter permease subunit [Stellaceae bacterium]|nr:ABC transporter permease subunit [Stellaceae bacterium]